MRSFKSNENIHKKEGGSYYVVSANKAKSYLPLYKIILSLSHQQKTDLCLNGGHCLWKKVLRITFWVEFYSFFLSRITMSLKIEDHKTTSESMRSKRVCQERDVNISLINVIDSACRC